MHHLTLAQRSQIEESLSRGLSVRQIGEIVGVHASTVSRELRRNRTRGRYNYVKADEMSATRRRNASTQFKKIKNQLKEKILRGLHNLWSPEQISGRLKTISDAAARFHTVRSVSNGEAHTLRGSLP